MQTKRLPTHNRLLEKLRRPMHSKPGKTKSSRNPRKLHRPNKQPIPSLGVHSTRRKKFQKAYSILEMPRRPTMLDKLKAQSLALWLNYVAGWTEGYALNGMSPRNNQRLRKRHN